MGAFDDVVADPALRLADVEAHLATIRDDRLYLGEYRIMASSGTTGRRGVYVWNQRDWLDLLGIIMRPTRALGIRPRLPRTRFALIGAPDAKHMTYRFGASMDAGVFRTLRLAATQPLPDLVAALQRFQPDVLTAYPSMAALLAAEQRAGRLRISPRAIGTSSELRTEEMTRAIREAWGVEPMNAYALTETGLAAWTCPEANALHVCEDSCILESVDDAGRPVPAGQPGSRLLVTSLLNYTQPVIRLEVSDQLTFAREPCACGRTLRVIEVLHGRADDILDLPGTSRRSGHASPHPPAQSAGGGTRGGRLPDHAAAARARHPGDTGGARPESPFAARRAHRRRAARSRCSRLPGAGARGRGHRARIPAASSSWSRWCAIRRQERPASLPP